MFLLVSSAVAVNDAVTRLSGPTRWCTSAAVALEAYPNGSDNVIIARGDNAGGWADGLSGGYLAGVLDAPILITAPDSLPDVVASAILSLGASKAYILGGTGAVSSGVESTLAGMGLATERIAGASREATAAQVAAMGTAADNTAFVVQGRAPADSMVAGAAAFAKGYPILLVNRNDIPLVTATAIVSLNIENIIIVGGTGVVSASVASELAGISGVNNVTRLAGADRVATSVAFAQNQFPDSINFSIVNGWRGLADAVGASVFGDPILYVNSLPSAVKNYLEGKVTANSHFYIFGGTGVIGSSVVNALQGLVADAGIKIKDGVWIADSPQIGEQAVAFHVKDGRITKDGSPLTMPNGVDPVSLIVRYPYSMGGFTVYVVQNIAISDTGQFVWESGSVGTPHVGYRKVNGTFTSNTSCSGQSYHKETSHEWNREMTYNWTAYHIDEYFDDPGDPDPDMDIKEGEWHGFDITYDSPREVVSVFVKDDKITSTGSTLEEGVCLEVWFVYDWEAGVGWIFRFTGDIPISDDNIFVVNTIVDDNGNDHTVQVAGVFLEPDDPGLPEQILYGVAFHEETGRSMGYEWLGFHEGDLASAENDPAEFEFDVSIFEDMEPVELDLEVEVMPIN